MGNLKFRWLTIGDTHMLFEHHEQHVVPEWQPIAQVTLRQVYEKQPPQWYVWWFHVDARVESQPFNTAGEAISFAETRCDCAGQTDRAC